MRVVRGCWFGAVLLTACLACGTADEGGDTARELTDGTGGNTGSEPPLPEDDGGDDAGEAPVDAGRARGDAGPFWDAGHLSDAGSSFDAGHSSDAGSGSPDAGVHSLDAGTPDAGHVPTLDGGSVDAGTVLSRVIQGDGGWTFYGQAQGGPHRVFQASLDEGGNLWVAGGEEGLFILRNGAAAFQHFTMADGLRPYGYLPDGGVPGGGSAYLKVISVEGGPSGTAFVGYQGQGSCEWNWDTTSPVPSIYKSGDADKVTLSGSGIQVVHYDIFSGPNVVAAEPRGRERLCTVFRVLYDPPKIWFGANHGFAMGFSSFAGNPTCNGQLSCTGSYEHVHPAINVWTTEAKTAMTLYTGSYRGMSVDPVTHDLWVGGDTRSTKFRITTAGNYWQAQVQTEASQYSSNRFDIWPDGAPDPTPSQRVEDLVTSAAAMADGTVWMGSQLRGLAHLDAQGVVMQRMSSELLSPVVLGLAADPNDQSLWVGGGGGAVQRMKDGQLWIYGSAAIGSYAGYTISDIRIRGSGSSRTVIVGFDSASSYSGVGLYRGN